MKHLNAILGLIGLTVLSGCSTMSNMADALNPFSNSARKISPLSQITAKREVRTNWTVNAGKAGDYVFSPAVVGKVIFVTGRDGMLSRIEEGKTIWKINVGQAISAGVGANEKVVAVGTQKGDVLAYSADDGRLLWQVKVSSEVLAPPAVGDDALAVKSGDNRVFLLDLKDGSRKWFYQRATPALSLRNSAPPIISDRFVFVGFPGGKLVALALQNGAPMWEGTVALPKGATELDRVADIVSAPAIDGRQVCAVAFQGRVACFDLSQSGALIWARDLSSAAGLAIDGNYLFVTDEKGAVHALDRSTGSSVWKQDKLVGRRVSGPAVAAGLVAVADAEGFVHFLAREDGSFVARQKTDGTPVNVPVQIYRAAMLVQTSGGDVSLIEAQ